MDDSARPRVRESSASLVRLLVRVSAMNSETTLAISSAYKAIEGLFETGCLILWRFVPLPDFECPVEVLVAGVESLRL